LTVFFAMSFAWAWSIWLIGPRVVRRFSHRSDFDGLDILLVLIGACGPSFAAFVTRWLADRDLKGCAIWTGWAV
jgi:hypothetical protein